MGVGVAVVKIQHKQKYIMLTYASERVRGHEIFRVNGLRKLRHDSVHSMLICLSGLRVI